MVNEPITIGEAARICRACEDSMRKWADAGLLPATRTPSGIRIFQRSSVEAFAAARAQRREQRGARSAGSAA